MKKRLMVGLAAGALVTAMVPGVTSAADGPANGLVATCLAAGGAPVNVPDGVYCEVPDSALNSGQVNALAGYSFICDNALPEWNLFLRDEPQSVTWVCALLH